MKEEHEMISDIQICFLKFHLHCRHLNIFVYRHLSLNVKKLFDEIWIWWLSRFLKEAPRRKVRAECVVANLLFLFLIQFPHNSLSDLSKHNTPWFKTFPMAWVVIQSLSHVRLFATPWTAAHHASLSFTISWSLLKPMSIEWMMPSITGLRENSKTDQDPAGPSEVKKCPSLVPISHL